MAAGTKKKQQPPAKSTPKGRNDTSAGASAAAAAASASASSASSKLKPATAINARHILCEKHARKEEALARLRAGASFSDVAREFSEDKARQGGALGWKVRGALVAEFERVAYALEVSGVGRPVWGECRSGEGYHVIMVEGRR